MIIDTDEIKDLFYKNLKGVRNDEMVHIDYVDEAVFDLAIELVKKLNIDDVSKRFSVEKLSDDGVFFSCSKCNYTPLMTSKTDDLLNMNFCPRCGGKFNVC